MSRIIRLAAPGLVALLPFVAAAQPQAPVRLAMMDMVPMGGGTAANAPMAQQAPMQPMQQMPAGQMPMPAQPSAPQAPMQMPTQGAGQMQAPATQPGMPMQQMPMQPGAGGAMAMCPMMTMMMQNMQTMMRMGGGQPGMPPADGSAAMAAPMGGGNSATRLEGRIAYLRTDLRITDAQAPAWEAFAAALRSGREHLDAARNSLSGANAAADPMVRLQAYESHLMARTEAVRSTRLAFNTLFAQLDDAQKRAATTTMLPFIGTF